MKIGMNMLLWTTHVTEEHFPLLERIKACGFDGVEIPLFEGDAAHFQKVRRVLDDLGLECTTVTVSGPDANPISPDQTIRQRAVESLSQVVEHTAILGGSRVCGPFYQPLGEFSGSAPTNDEKSYAADVHRQVAESAKGANITLCVEYLNRFECYFLNTMADAADYVQRVDHPNVRTMYDTFHANIEEKDPVAAYTAHVDVISHIHISENDRGTPGKGHVPWRETFRAIRSSGYDSWLTIEAFGRALPDLAAATRVWRDFFPSREEVYEEGIKFIRSQWEEAA